MAEIAEKHSSRLPELKKSVEESYQYFEANIKRYKKFMRFVFKSSISPDEASALASTGKPNIEFNVLESLISRQRGEFAKQQPNLTVRAADGVPDSFLTPQFSQTIDVVEAHLRATFFDGTNDMLQYNIFSDLLAGGFSGMRVFTDYINEKSFEQNIFVERVFDPTLMFFDPLARDSHKGDGRFCGELYPMTRKRFEDDYGADIAREMKFSNNLGGFNWSFQNEKEEIVLVCDYYEKKKKKVKILKLSNGHTVTDDEYAQLLEKWEQQGMIEQPPLPVKERKTNIERIVRYRFCEGSMLDYVETNYKYLPIIFVDGNSVNIEEAGAYGQMTRPYVYHAEGIQKLKNFAGQSLANELENTVQHKFKVAIEGVPLQYLEAYKNVQKMDVLLYNHFLDSKNPEIILPPPQEIVRPPIPPEIPNTFRMSDEMTQAILGNYDAAQGMAGAQLSGIAFARSAIQSNNASVPYIVGFIKGLNRAAQIYIDLMPKYFKTPRSIPVQEPDGKRNYVMINTPDSQFDMGFDPNCLCVKVEAGVNYAMQKEIALQTIIAMSQANPLFAQFMGEEGLPILLDNIDIKGIDQIKEKANAWLKQQKQMQQQQQQQGQQMQMQAQQMQQQKMQLDMQKSQMQVAEMQKDLQGPTEAQIKIMEMQQKSQLDDAKLTLQARDSETKFLETMSKIRNADVENELRAAEVQAEQSRTELDAALKLGHHIATQLGGE